MVIYPNSFCFFFLFLPNSFCFLFSWLLIEKLENTFEIFGDFGSFQTLESRLKFQVPPE